MPRGLIWRREQDAVQSVVIEALAALYERSTERSNELLVEARPIAPLELISEWEATLGLPDPCVGVPVTLQQRQLLVAARFRAMGGQTPDYYIGVARDLGIIATVTEYAAGLIVDVGAVEQPLNNDSGWLHAWRINIAASELSITEFAAGVSVAGEPLRTWGNNGLECVISRIKPAQTSVFYSYES